MKTKKTAILTVIATKESWERIQAAEPSVQAFAKEHWSRGLSEDTELPIQGKPSFIWTAEVPFTKRTEMAIEKIRRFSDFMRAQGAKEHHYPMFSAGCQIMCGGERRLLL